MDSRVVGIISALGGAAAATAVCLAVTTQSGTAASSDDTPTVTVTECTPGQALDMTLQVHNPTPVPGSYQIHVYWFQPDGKPYVDLSVTTDAIPAGQTATVTAGNPNNTAYWKSGLTCQAKIVASQ